MSDTNKGPSRREFLKTTRGQDYAERFGNVPHVVRPSTLGLEDYADRGIPGEFGRKFRVPGFVNSHQTSPAISPSGDLVAAFTTYKGDVDVAIFGLPDRQLYKNLTKGMTNKCNVCLRTFMSI